MPAAFPAPSTRAASARPATALTARRSRPARRKLQRALGLAVGALVLAGCGSSAPKPTGAPTSTATAPRPESPDDPTIDVRFFPQVDTKVLADAQGFALYVYAPDQRKAVTCAGACTVSWPPVFQASGAPVHTGAGVETGLVSSDRDPVKGRVVTYDGWPLYTYGGDVQPGFSVGQATDIDGGYWYLIRPDGRPLRRTS